MNARVSFLLPRFVLILLWFTDLSGANLPCFFIDPAAPGLPHRLYRAVSP